jgi:hypothetical protein
MSYQDFLTTLKSGLSDRIEGNVTLEIRSFPRNNDTSYDGLVILQPDRNVSPTIYLPPYYHRYLEGVSLAEIYEDIISTYERHLPTEDFDTSLFTDFAKASPHIVMRLVSRARNASLLKTVPFFRFQDLAVLFYCMVYANGETQANILIHRDHLSLWDIDADELYRLAVENTARLLPPQIIPMSRVLQENASCGGEELTEQGLPMFILTNEYRTHGATTLLYDGLLSQLAEKFESDLIVLPSSVHETILLPISDPDEADFAHYNRLVQEVNETQLADDEVLSDHAYLFSREEKLLSIPYV